MNGAEACWTKPAPIARNHQAETCSSRIVLGWIYPLNGVYSSFCGIPVLRQRRMGVPIIVNTHHLVAGLGSFPPHVIVPLFGVLAVQCLLATLLLRAILSKTRPMPN